MQNHPLHFLKIDSNYRILTHRADGSGTSILLSMRRGPASEGREIGERGVVVIVGVPERSKEMH
jgi:hypothetical protein